MKRVQSVILLAAVVVASAARVAAAGEVTVIANPSVKASEISADELKGVFLATKTSLADGSAVEPVLAKAGTAHDQFLKDYLGKTDAALATYYRSLVFTGKASMPKICATDAEVAAYVAKTKGAIGYVGKAAAANGGVKTLTVK